MDSFSEWMAAGIIVSNTASSVVNLVSKIVEFRMLKNRAATAIVAATQASVSAQPSQRRAVTSFDVFMDSLCLANSGAATVALFWLFLTAPATPLTFKEASLLALLSVTAVTSFVSSLRR